MAGNIVVDASVALSWVLPGEASGSALQLREQAIADNRLRLYVPPIFWYEVANALWVAAHRERLTENDAIDAFEALINFQFDVCPADLIASLRISFEKGLAVYDSAYLSAAVRCKATLWTVDKALAAAARSLGVRVEPA